jgi:hypothetical protein
MTAPQRLLSYAAPALAVVFALSLAGRADAAASCGHYVTYKGMPAAHDMPDHSTGQPMSHEHGPADKCPCQGPNCSQAPLSAPPVAPTTKLTLEKDSVHYSLCEFVLERGSIARLCAGDLLATLYSPSDVFRPPCCA